MSQFVFLSTLPTAGSTVDTGFKALNLFNTYGLNVSVKSDVHGTLNVIWSNDASGTPVEATDTDSITTFDHSKQYKVKGKYVKLSFTNRSGAIDNTIFNLKASVIEQNIVSTLPMDVNIVSGASSGGDASAANQLITHTKLDTINTTLTGTLTVDGSAATQPISAVSLPLPTGAATETTLDAVKTAVEGTLTVDGSGVTQPVSAVALPLPTGAATETTLSSVNSALAGTLTVDGSGVTQPVSATALPLPTGAATEVTLSSVNSALAGTLTVDGSGVTQPVSATALPLPTGAATEATLADATANVAALAATITNDKINVDVSSQNVGTYNNVASNITLNAGATTTAVSIAEIARGNLFYEDSLTSSLDGLTIQVSADNTNWHNWGQILPYQAAGASVRSANVVNGSAHGLKWLRLRNDSATDNYTNVKASVYGSH